ncbi:MAG: hypothetical protein E7L44_04345 [Leuconostoc citreum]|nr:hypothetical protein [Leuconostoc citreum]
MLTIIVNLFRLIIIISAIGTFVSFVIFSNVSQKSQKIWLSILILSVLRAFLFSAVPDFIDGFITGFSGK